jgi:hypothetical protein
MLANSSPASTPSLLELSIFCVRRKKPTLAGSGGAVQERPVRRSGPRPNYTNLVYEQVYTHLKARFTRHRIGHFAESVFSPFTTVAVHFIYACSYETAADRIQ